MGVGYMSFHVYLISWMAVIYISYRTGNIKLGGAIPMVSSGFFWFQAFERKVPFIVYMFLSYRYGNLKHCVETTAEAVHLDCSRLMIMDCWMGVDIGQSLGCGGLYNS